MASLVDRVAAQSRNVRVLRVLLWVLAAPFYVLGFVVAGAWVAILWAFGALKVGFADARALGRKPAPRGEST